jgi:hypothetical protein
MNVKKLKKRKVMESKFDPLKDNRSFTEKLKSFGKSLLFWRGREKGIIHTRTIEWGDIRFIFFQEDLRKSMVI